jgi:hypothetical protein
MSYDNLSNVILRNTYSSCCTSYRVKYPTFRHIKCNNSGMAKVKTVKNERDPPLFTGKLLIKFQNILISAVYW